MIETADLAALVHCSLGLRICLVIGAWSLSGGASDETRVVACRYFTGSRSPRRELVGLVGRVGPDGEGEEGQGICCEKLGEHG